MAGQRAEETNESETLATRTDGCGHGVVDDDVTGHVEVGDALADVRDIMGNCKGNRGETFSFDSIFGYIR